MEAVTDKSKDTDLIKETPIPLDATSSVLYVPSYIHPTQATDIFHHLLNDIEWRKSSMTAKDRSIYQLPRLQCWMSDPYVKAQLYQKEGPMMWSEPIFRLKQQLENDLNAWIQMHSSAKNQCACKFDYVLMNYYRNGLDKIGFHRDDEAEEDGKNIIASLSFGAKRKFIIRHCNNKKLNHHFDLTHGSLIVMMGDTQINWKHSIPEEPELLEARINLTFRKS